MWKTCNERLIDRGTTKILPLLLTVYFYSAALQRRRMGAAASATSPLSEDAPISSLGPEKMNEEEAKIFARKLLGERCKTINLYGSFSEDDGLASREKIIAVVTDTTEQELYSLFVDYTEDGVLMNNACFLDILKDVKVLSKADLSSHYASIIFKDATAHMPQKRVNFTFFRNTLIPIVASKKQWTVEALVRRFCVFENRKITQESIQVQSVQSVPPLKKELSVEIVLKVSNEVQQAVRKLQNLGRRRNATARVEYLKECSIARVDPNIKTLVQSSVKDEGEEEKLLALFTRYSESYDTTQEFRRVFKAKGRLERRQFVLMCHHAKLTNLTRFTVLDCNQVFDKAKAIALNPAAGVSYRDDVYFNKRIGFSVFRDIVIPCLEEKTKLDKHAILLRLISIPEDALND